MPDTTLHTNMYVKVSHDLRYYVVMATPNLEAIGSSRTKKCMDKRVSDCKTRRASAPGSSFGSSSSEMPSKIKRLCNTDVAEFIVEKTILEMSHTF